MTKNILIIGSGNRVTNNFLPVLDPLSHRFSVTAIYSRNFANAAAVARTWGLHCVRSLTDVDWQAIDVVVVSVTQRAVPSVLEDIARYKTNMHLVVDTPALQAAHIFHAKKYARFMRVSIAEDFINFPQFELMRQWSYLNGPVRKVHISHAGYDYHALALARSFFGFLPVQSIRKTDLPDGATASLLDFGNNRSAEIRMPYKRSIGSVTIEADLGKLTWSPECPQHDSYKDSFVRPQFSHTLTGFRAGEITLHLPYLEWFLETEELSDKSVFNLLKCCGLVRIFENIDKPNLNSNYGAAQGIYDSALARMLRRSPWVQASALSMLPSMCAKALPKVPQSQVSLSQAVLKALA